MSKSLPLTLAATLLLAACSPASPSATATATPTTEAEVRLVVNEFGVRLKNVSLLAADADAQMQAEYGDLVTAELLSVWQAGPQSAPGRLTSSPWPERIEISAIAQISESEFRVAGAVVEATSNDPRSHSYSVDITVSRVDGKWLISAYRLNQ